MRFYASCAIAATNSLNSIFIALVATRWHELYRMAGCFSVNHLPQTKTSLVWESSLLRFDSGKSPLSKSFRAKPAPSLVVFITHLGLL
ncbi:MAG: hypothetical protein QQW96_13750 [Tychonema bourrellyi B0820]|uniref:hypothetical protein n=1 Tax=Tychonema bourrellyi TaxID=54313 RepID=UPI001181106F|nr:hypothetical protein [Tychonema bourrellyi]MDQ2098699.1 hypothetical protein [Tychonema bourrellyi B0820]